MELQLQEFLDKIKSDGIDAAKAEAAALIARAEDQARALVATAQAEVAAARTKAAADLARQDEAARASLAQASRDALLSFRDGISRTLSALTAAEVGAAYGPEVLPEAIAAAVRGLADGKAGDLAVLLPPELLSTVEARLQGLLAAELKKGLTIQAGPSASTGFRIVQKDGSAYYDFSAPAVAALFSTRLSARLASVIEAAATGL